MFAGGGGGPCIPRSEVAGPAQWAVFYDTKTIIGYPGTPVAAPTTYANAREAAIAFMHTLKGDLAFIAHTNSRSSVPGTYISNLEEAFPTTEQVVKEYHGVSIMRAGDYLHRVYLFPLTSYLWANVRRFWEAEEEEEDRDDDRYEEESYYGYDEEEEPWRRHCTCDASGPYFCSCRNDDDD